MLNQPFFQVTLPIMATMVATAWALISTNNKRLDDVVDRLGRIEDRLLAIDSRLSAPVASILGKWSGIPRIESRDDK
jgi:hypothetical protein